ncbi:MAG: hypothetical protein U1E45_20985 [Geminicoccaceae bacterium]
MFKVLLPAAILATALAFPAQTVSWPIVKQPHGGCAISNPDHSFRLLQRVNGKFDLSVKVPAADEMTIVFPGGDRFEHVRAAMDPNSPKKLRANDVGRAIADELFGSKFVEINAVGFDIGPLGASRTAVADCVASPGLTS